jgi:CBS domain-containing protein
VHQQNIPIGIITDVDLRTKIATGRFYITALVNKIMSSPVITVASNISLSEAVSCSVDAVGTHWSVPPNTFSMV